VKIEMVHERERKSNFINVFIVATAVGGRA